MNTKNAKYVDACDLWEGIPDFAEVFYSTDQDFTWGDCKYSLISQVTFIDAVKELEVDQAKIDLVIDRINALPDDVYINLE